MIPLPACAATPIVAATSAAAVADRSRPASAAARAGRAACTPGCAPHPLSPRQGLPVRPGADSGRAIIEVVFLAVLLLIPTVYILIGVIRLQAATLAVAQSARDVGRLIETSPQLPTAEQALAVARIALDDQHVASDRLRIVTTGRGGSCADATAMAVSREPGSDYDVCVIAVIDLPGVPTALTGSNNTVTGVYAVHIDPIREGK